MYVEKRCQRTKAFFLTVLFAPDCIFHSKTRRKTYKKYKKVLEKNEKMKMLNKENKSKRQASYTKNGRKAKLKAKRKMPRFWPRVECSVQGSGVTERGSVRIILYYSPSPQYIHHHTKQTRPPSPGPASLYCNFSISKTILLCQHTCGQR